MHKPYQEIRGYQPDFRVHYRFYSKEEGGRQGILPYQGYRSDFWYEHEYSKSNVLYMIHPEFEDENQNVILYDNQSISREGTALMWILMPEMRSYHIQHLRTGAKGYFMEGSRKVAECIVTEILSLNENPLK